MVKLKDIAVISSGAFFRPSPTGAIKYLHSRHFSSDGKFLDNAFGEIDEEKCKKHLLEDGQILFSSKGSANFAALYRDNMGACIASSTFCVIKITSSGYSPEFVCWLLNHPTTQNWVKSQSVGTSVMHISITNLQEIEIPLIDIEQQLKIVDIAKLAEKESTIEKRLIELKKLRINHMLISKTK